MKIKIKKTMNYLLVITIISIFIISCVWAQTDEMKKEEREKKREIGKQLGEILQKVKSIEDKEEQRKIKRELGKALGESLRNIDTITIDKIEENFKPALDLVKEIPLPPEKIASVDPTKLAGYSKDEVKQNIQTELDRIAKSMKDLHGEEAKYEKFEVGPRFMKVDATFGFKGPEEIKCGESGDYVMLGSHLIEGLQGLIDNLIKTYQAPVDEFKIDIEKEWTISGIKKEDYEKYVETIDADQSYGIRFTPPCTDKDKTYKITLKVVAKPTVKGDEALINWVLSSKQKVDYKWKVKVPKQILIAEKVIIEPEQPLVGGSAECKVVDKDGNDVDPAGTSYIYRWYEKGLLENLYTTIVSENKKIENLLENRDYRCGVYKDEFKKGNEVGGASFSTKKEIEPIIISNIEVTKTDIGSRVTLSSSKKIAPDVKLIDGNLLQLTLFAKISDSLAKELKFTDEYVKEIKIEQVADIITIKISLNKNIRDRDFLTKSEDDKFIINIAPNIGGISITRISGRVIKPDVIEVTIETDTTELKEGEEEEKEDFYDFTTIGSESIFISLTRSAISGTKKHTITGIKDYATEAEESGEPGQPGTLSIPLKKMIRKIDKKIIENKIIYALNFAELTKEEEIRSSTKVLLVNDCQEPGKEDLARDIKEKLYVEKGWELSNVDVKKTDSPTKGATRIYYATILYKSDAELLNNDLPVELKGSLIEDITQASTATYPVVAYLGCKAAEPEVKLPLKVKITPAAPTDNDNLECVIENPEQGVEYFYMWSYTSTTSQPLSAKGKTIAASATRAGEKWTCSVYKNEDSYNRGEVIGKSEAVEIVSAKKEVSLERDYEIIRACYEQYGAECLKA